MLRKLILAAGIALALFAPAYAADPQTFKTEDSATAFCKSGNLAASQTQMIDHLLSRLYPKKQQFAAQCVDTGVHCTPGGIPCCDDGDTCYADPGSSSTYCHF